MVLKKSHTKGTKEEKDTKEEEIRGDY